MNAFSNLYKWLFPAGTRIELKNFSQKLEIRMKLFNYFLKHLIKLSTNLNMGSAIFTVKNRNQVSSYV